MGICFQMCNTCNSLRTFQKIQSITRYRFLSYLPFCLRCLLPLLYIPALSIHYGGDFLISCFHVLQRTGQTKYIPNGRQREINRGPSCVSSAASNSFGVGSPGPETLSSMLAAATPGHQKHILGERLYPLVQKHKVKFVKLVF